MGNNKKTVRCGFCGRLGHNRVSCPKLKEMIEKEREQHGSDHPDVKLYDELSKGYSRKSSSNASKVRHCRYCMLPNHNVRSCKIRAKDFADLKKKNHRWRTVLLNRFSDMGMGTGCIMTSKYSKRYGSKMYSKGDRWILTAIYWDKITFDDTSQNPDDYKVFKLVNLNNPSVQTLLSISQMFSINERTELAEPYWEVLSPSYALDFPHGWDTIGDATYDKHLVSVFKGLDRIRYEDIVSYSFGGKPLILLLDDEDLAQELRQIKGEYE